MKSKIILVAVAATLLGGASNALAQTTYFEDDFECNDQNPFGAAPQLWGWSSNFGTDGWRTDLSAGLSPNTDSNSGSFGGAIDNYENFLLTGHPTWTDVAVEADMTNDDDDGMGLVVRYEDTSGYYVCSMTKNQGTVCDGSSNAVGNRVTLQRVTGDGTAAECLGASYIVDSDPAPVFAYTAGSTYRMRLEAVGQNITCTIDADLDGMLGSAGDIVLGHTQIDGATSGLAGVASFDNGNADTGNPGDLVFDNVLIEGFDPDMDMDGLPDAVELAIGTNPNNPDSDGDGILDRYEALMPQNPPNTDGGPEINAQDDDSDGDGILDIDEGGGNPPIDTDCDGLPDYVDLDSDGDGVPDATDNCRLDDNPAQTNTDGDPLGDACDPDDDDDGVPDGMDTDPTDPNVCGDSDADMCDDCSSGMVDPANDGTDTDADGLCNTGDPDDDNDGVDDGQDSDPLNPNQCSDIDNDGCEDCLGGVFDRGMDGPDADADGLCDAGETTAGTDPNDADSDDDGALDGVEPSWNVDSDGDGLINALDPDSDNDALYDGTELGLDCNNADTDTSLNHCVADTDPGSTTDPLDRDSDNGTVTDGSEDADLDGNVDGTETDPNAIGDDNITDSDNDGLSDALEMFLGSDPNDADSDDDGTLDGDEANPADDTDGDGLINILDPDSDDDGLFDGTEQGFDCSNPATETAFGNCIADGDNGGTTTSPLIADTDGGGVNDGDEDSDRDGVVDGGETDPNDQADDGAPTDSDNDGLSDDLETTLGTDPNDADSDDDGIIDGDEPSFGADTDGDGLINALDPDSDDDGLTDGTEVGLDCNNPATDATAGNCTPDGDSGVTATNPLDADTDDGGVSDGAEDFDLDGVVDAGETDPNDPSDDNAVVDTDGDGLSDELENTIGTDPMDADSDDDGLLDGEESNPGLDFDGDGLIQGLDPDSDNDGLFDGTETSNDCTAADTDVAAGHCIEDADPTTRTQPLDADTDDGGVIDGSEDINRNGAIDAGELDPNDPSDDMLVTDTDGDGLSDALEMLLMTDPNDADSDDDGVVDGQEPNYADDTDGDGTINALDPDSDMDGLFDGTELGLDCSDQATDAAAMNCIEDGDAGATTTSPLNPDTDGGSVSDGDEDTDKDGVVDAGETDPNDPSDDTMTMDSDNDGLTDAEEVVLGTDPMDADSDDDGTLDGAEIDPGVDSDGDGLINALDPDSDNDGIADGTEQGFDCANGDTDVNVGNCIADGDNGVTVTDPLDADTDDGGVIDGSEDANANGVIDAGEGDPNDPSDDANLIDTDGDGLTDATEANLGTDPNDADSDDDGVPDGSEPNFANDTDGDGLINPLDPDSDDDGLFDGTELGLDCSDPATDVAAGNCIEDADGGATTTSPLLADTDGGGVIDGDEDTNKNGQVDPGERDPNDPSDDMNAPGCVEDADCGNLTSGMVCDMGVCVDGCRGDGNGCPDGQTCTSADDTVGQCSDADPSRRIVAEGNGFCSVAQPGRSTTAWPAWLLLGLAFVRRRRAA